MAWSWSRAQTSAQSVEWSQQNEWQTRAAIPPCYCFAEKWDQSQKASVWREKVFGMLSATLSLFNVYHQCLVCSCLQEKQLYIVREIVSAEKDIRDETREKLAMLSNTGRYSRGNFDSPGDRLNTINELNSTGSLLASFDLTTERTEEELELSVMRSSRAPRGKRTSEGMYNLDNSKRYKASSNREVQFKVSLVSVTLLPTLFSFFGF